MESGQSTVAMATFHLPMDLTMDVLSRLPVKSLLRFKSVCKSWYALIQSPNFISKHQTHSTINPNLGFGSILLTTHNPETQSYGISLLFNDGFDGPVDIDFPFLIQRNYLSVVGICNGLVCISFSCFGCPLILCNPSTRQFRQIPHYKWWDKRGTKMEVVTFGFGFHPAANDYKLIRIVYYSTCVNEKLVVRAELYTMSTDTWREINVKMPSFFDGEVDAVVPCEIREDSASALLNGVLYWPAYVLPFEDVIVVSFDMGDEVLRKIRTPRCLDEKWHNINWQLTSLKDKLALIIYPDDNRSFDIWLFNEDKRNWTKKFKVGALPRIASPLGSGDNGEIILVGGTENGELIVEDRTKSGDLNLSLYNPKSRGTKNLPFARVEYPYEIHLYRETLLPVRNDYEVKKENEDNELVLKQRKKKQRNH